MELNRSEKRTSQIHQRVTPTIKKKGKKIVEYLKKQGVHNPTEADMLEIVINEYEQKISN